MRVIAEKGFSSTSIREIAREADVSIGTLGHHFESKDEILLACMDRVIQTYAEIAEGILKGSGRPLARLERLIDVVLGDPSLDYLWRIYMAFWHEAVFDSSVKSSILEGNIAWDASMAACIQEAIDAGEIDTPDPNATGKLLSTLMCGVAIDVHGRLGRWDRESAIELCKAELARHRRPRAREARQARPA
jgi:AcrR family transcriptional regulator